jgi:ubiquinone biosynthesis monooxygenase Coq7
MRRLPGDLSEEQDAARMIRVDHAGEYGAMRIYAGQLAVMGKTPGRKLVEHMAAQEQQHLQTFEALMRERKVRPTALMPLWHIAGFALGAATALMGEKAAFACTVAVESVIDEHYAAQRRRLGDSESELAQTIEKFRADEIEHRDTSLAQGAEEAPLYPVLSAGVKAASKLAIWLSTRI